MRKIAVILIMILATSVMKAQEWNPRHPGWTDSFEANGFCWCASTNYDHDLDTKSLEINGTDYNIRTVCDELKNHPLYRAYQEGDAPFNDIQCGNGPANNADDEDPLTGCPGRTDLGPDGCDQIGTTFDMDWLESRAMFGGDTPTTFIPDPNKTYYIDSAHHNVRLAATGESEDAYTTNVTTTGADVEWKFVDKGNGYWHIQRAAGGTKPRLRRENNPDADMQATTSSGSWTYYEITKGDIGGSYFLTLPDAPVAYNRLQVDRSLDVKMVPSANHNGTWESFNITEVRGTTAVDTRLEAEDFDNMLGVRAEDSTESGENIGYINNGDWLLFNGVNLTGITNMDARVSSRFTGGTVEVRLGSVAGTLIGSIDINNTGGDQNWTTLSTSISNASGTQDIYLVFTGGNGYLFNINWVEFNTGTQSNKGSETTKLNESLLDLYPNPAKDSFKINISNIQSVKIFNVSGELIKSFDEAKDEYSIGDLVTGFYLVETTDKEGKSSMRKLIKD